MYDSAALSCALSHRLIEPVQQQASIGQAGELIVVRHVTHLRFLSREPLESLLET